MKDLFDYLVITVCTLICMLISIAAGLVGVVAAFWMLKGALHVMP